MIHSKFVNYPKIYPVNLAFLIKKALTTGTMSKEASREKYFVNDYPDYAPENAGTLIENKKLPSTHRLVTSLQKKWESTMEKLRFVEYNDYSVYTGTSGIALLKLRQNPTDETNLKEVVNLLCLHKLKARRHTFLCGDAGPLAIGAVVFHKLGNEAQSKELINKLLNMQEDVFDELSDLPNEFLYGRAGYLYAIMFVNKQVSPPPFDDHFIRKVIEVMLLCGRNEAKAGKFKFPLMYQWHDSYYLGAAHGVSGIIYMLLQVKEYLNESELSQLIKPTIDYLSTIRFPSGNYPSSLGRDEDRLVQWCHGAPGFVYMYSLAYKVFGDPKYLQLACEAGDVIWQRGILKKGYSICHGVSGNGYAFLELYQTTQDPKHLYRALKFAEYCLDYAKNREGHYPDRPLSLFEGIAGPMYYLLDIQNPMEAKFPGFTL